MMIKHIKPVSVGLAVGLCLAAPFSARADYFVDLLSGGQPSRVAAPSSVFDLDVHLTSTGADKIDVAQFRLAFSMPGLRYQGYTWSAPFPNRSFEDDSRPKVDSLPARLTADTLAGPGIPAGEIDIQLSNITDILSEEISYFGNGLLVRLNFAVPEDFPPHSHLSVSLVPESFAQGFDPVAIADAKAFTLTVVPEVNGGALFALAALAAACWLRRRARRLPGA
jgi:hypothetical protein